MFVYVAGRQQGKTLATVRWLLEKPQHRAILVSNAKRKDHIMRTLQQLGPIRDRSYWSFRIIVVQQLDAFRDIDPRGIAQELAIDDLDEVLKAVFGSRVDFATVNATPLLAGTWQRNFSLKDTSPAEPWIEDSKEPYYLAEELER